MIVTVVKVMWLALWRDRGALALAFVLPPLLFVVFAEVFSGAGDADLELRVAVLDSAASPLTGKITRAVEGLAGIEPVAHPCDTEPEPMTCIRAMVRRAQVDAALWLRAEPEADLDAEAPLVVIGDGARVLAATIVMGRVQALLESDFPGLNVQRAVALVDVLAGPFTEEQRELLDIAIEELASERLEPDDADDLLTGGFVTQQLLTDGRSIDPGVSYYAGAVAIMFLLFAAMQGAISLIDERNSGIVDRLVAGPGGYTVVVIGKGIFLTLQGLVQVGLIFAVAWWGFGLDWPAHFGLWLVTAILAASLAAWSGLLLASLCRTRQQAQTASAFLVLILSAIGGSMMPRFMMPGWLRDLGWFTPNAWVIESWQGMYWRGDGIPELLPGWLILLAAALLAMLATVWTVKRMAREK